MKIVCAVLLFLMFGWIYAQPTSISGNVVLEEDGKTPVDGVKVHVVYDSSETIIDEGETLTDSSGFYRIENLEPGYYTVDIEKTGYYPVTYPELVHLRQNEAISGIDFEAITYDVFTYSISGEVRLLDYYGEEWQGKVAVFSPQGYLLGEAPLVAPTDTTGTHLGLAEYQIESLPLLPCYVEAAVTGYIPQYYNHVYASEEATEVYPSDPPVGDIDFDLERASDSTLTGGVSGLISGRHGSLSYSSIYAKKEGQLVTGCLNNEVGTYWMPLDPGVYSVYATRAGYKTGEYYGSITIADQEVPTINIYLNRNGTASTEQGDHNTALSDSSVDITPNPFVFSTTVSYDLSKAGTVTVKLYDGSGSLVGTLANEYKTPGTYQLSWNGNDFQGHTLPSGVYFCRITHNNLSVVKPIILIR